MPRRKVVYGAQTLTRVLIPVALCMMIVIINVKIMDNHKESNPQLVIGLFNSYHANESPISAVIIFLFIICATSFGVICYKYKLYKLIKIYLLINTIMTFHVYFYFHLRNVFGALDIPMSNVTAVFVVLNFATLGLISIHWKSSIRLNQFYMIIMAALTSLFFLNNLPDWTVWLVLIAMSLWDLFAVLAPCGPLRLMVRTAQRRGDDSFPAILYSAMSHDYGSTSMNMDLLSTNRSEDMSTQRSSSSTSFLNQPKDEIEGTVRLGLGDFVFYSLMIANVVQTSNTTTTFACFISNLAGLAITLPIVSLSQRPLPALPFPLLFAAVFYFFSHIALTPFTQMFYSNLILI